MTDQEGGGGGMLLMIDPERARQGLYCNKGFAGCFCAVGWPYERQCPACRDRWPEGAFRDSYCICPPPDEEGKR